MSSSTRYAALSLHLIHRLLSPGKYSCLERNLRAYSNMVPLGPPNVPLESDYRIIFHI